MQYLTHLTKEDMEYVTKVTSFINDTETMDEHYEYAGNFAIANSVEQWELECNPCCGSYEAAIHCPSGKRVFFCFDYGH